MVNSRQLLNVRQQVAQAKADAASVLELARRTRHQRQMDHFAGRVAAFLAIIEIIDIEVDAAGQQDSPRKRK